ncbi:MAG: ParB/RepB/Spo0J family partition protein [Anaerolineae bacterium]|nr:ParB/RepB/Spo0J family partition protein [Anaerolineae bacterium]
MKRRPGLGKGLDALIPPSESALPASGINHAPVDKIIPNPRQPRTIFKEDELAELAASIKEHGVIQPLVVTAGALPGEYILIAGERRLQASRQANLAAVPVIIREASDQQLLELALIENVQRADLNPLEAAEAYQHLANEFGLTQDIIAERVGKSRVAITNTMGLLELSKAVKQALVDGQISEGHARALKPLSTQSQSAALQTVINQELNVRQTEALARKLKGHKPVSKPKPGMPPELQELQAQLRDALGTKVGLNHGSNGGTIQIHYYSDEELDALVARLTGE